MNFLKHFLDRYLFRRIGMLKCRSTMIDDNGIVIEVKDTCKSNLIVTTARDTFATLITDPNDHRYLIRYVALGEGHHALGDPDTPITPVISEVALETERFRKSYTSSSYPDARSVEYYTLVDFAEANDYPWYTEIGLFSDEVMFAINVPYDGSAWYKNDHIKLEYWWRVVF